MQVFVDLTRFAATATRAQLRHRVRELEDVGATDVSVSDHIFFARVGVLSSTRKSAGAPWWRRRRLPRVARRPSQPASVIEIT